MGWLARGSLVVLGIVLVLAGLFAWSLETNYGSGSNWAIEQYSGGPVRLYSVDEIAGEETLVLEGSEEEIAEYIREYEESGRNYLVPALMIGSGALLVIAALIPSLRRARPMSQQPPVPAPPKEPQTPEGQASNAPSPKRRYNSTLVVGFAFLTGTAALLLVSATSQIGWLAVAAPSVLLVAGIVLAVIAKSPNPRSIGMGVLIGSAISLAAAGLCVVPSVQPDHLGRDTCSAAETDAITSLAPPPAAPWAQGAPWAEGEAGCGFSFIIGQEESPELPTPSEVLDHYRDQLDADTWQILEYSGDDDAGRITAEKSGVILTVLAATDLAGDEERLLVSVAASDE